MSKKHGFYFHIGCCKQGLSKKYFRD
ncbi:hypothetical protein NITGR_190053 [Nitrospina gracilis 3/211]|uniref:Uncharacterized protein n=1 Tax=Nitrospina gracilis (strain 3/211) TaxID=1266370 RepID=M1YXB9_NITG3|nr:hypothetical protein NITGR_190053 [Nitrospina gracilis 3/211]